MEWRQSHWRWRATRELADADVTPFWRIGQQRWGVENHAFNEHTKFHHLTTTVPGLKRRRSGPGC